MKLVASLAERAAPFLSYECNGPRYVSCRIDDKHNLIRTDSPFVPAGRMRPACFPRMLLELPQLVNRLTIGSEEVVRLTTLGRLREVK